MDFPQRKIYQVDFKTEYNVDFLCNPNFLGYV
jgi:hypothetical protein